MQFEREGSPLAGWRDVAFAVALALPTTWAWAGVVGAVAATVEPAAAAAYPFLALVLAPFAIAAASARVSRKTSNVVAEVTWLLLVPVWGFVLDALSPLCDHGCEDQYQPVAWPGIFVVYAVYAAGLAGWTLHRLRPRPQHGGVEGLIAACLLAGLVVCGALALHFGPMVIYGVVFAPAGLPLAGPWVSGAVFGLALWSRARAQVRPLLGAAAATAGWLGLDLVLHAVLTGRLGLWGGAMSDTCGWVLSVRTPPVEDCHYLCTVAAQGHPWLVRPLRLGRRRGVPIVVNRQLAVANAFEDLLHERWPRFGRLARRTYDRLAFPVSRWLLHPLAADAVFLAMLPAQAVFEGFLWAFDGDRERRIDRMYR